MKKFRKYANLYCMPTLYLELWNLTYPPDMFKKYLLLSFIIIEEIEDQGCEECAQSPRE